MYIWEKIKEHRFMILLLLVFIVAGLWYVFNHDEEYEVLNEGLWHNIQENETVDTANQQEQEVESIKIIVDVKGAVKHPGVYEIEQNARVIDVIQQAGGTLADADVNAINLAAFLQDGQVVYIPRIGEENASWLTQGESISVSNNSALININRASASELEQLPGIGPSKAKAIIQYREEHGPFSDVQQLLNVSGIGEKTLEKLLPYITVR